MSLVATRSALAVAVLSALAACAGSPHSREAAPVAAANQALPGDPLQVVPLQGARNVRSLAGLGGRPGLASGSPFLRSADLNHLTPADRDALAARGVSFVLDLRTAEEAASAPDPLAHDARFRYQRISLLGSESLDLAHLPESLGELYVKSLRDNGPQYRAVFEALAREQQGTVLFHCTAGKDRTGMIAAVLQSLAGVPRSRIVHDYSLSAQYLGDALTGPQMQQMLRANPKIGALMGSPPEAIEAYLDALENQYGGVNAYLKSIGVSDTDLQRLKIQVGRAR